MTKKAVAKIEDPDERERNWMSNCAAWPYDTVGHILSAMGKVYRGYCQGHISEKTYKLLFAGLKEMRLGREAEAQREMVRDLGVPFVGLVLNGPVPPDQDALAQDAQDLARRGSPVEEDATQRVVG